MIIILSDNSYIEYVLKGLELYRKLGVSTVNSLNKLDTINSLVIVDEKVADYEHFPAVITISHKLSSDLQKPFHIFALISLINKKLKTLNNYLLPNKFSFFFNKRLLTNTTNRTLRLTEKEANLLKHLLKNPNYFISKNKMLQEIWGYKEELETTTLETHIYHLRSKFRKLGIEDMIVVEKDKIKISI